ADHYFTRGRLNGKPEDNIEAEKNYQLVSNNTNLPPSNLTYEARLMAARAAFARQGWSDAIRYLTNLTSDPRCPLELQLRARYAYGDTLMMLGDSAETNKMGNYLEAIRVFNSICVDFPSNSIAALAWGEMANCYLQWAQNPHNYEFASNAFVQVIGS